MTDVVEFDSRQAASLAAAETMAAGLTSALAKEATATIVVAGGSTPTLCFENLSHIDLGWDNVTVVMSDERWVPATHDSSNERMIRECLCINAARDAVLLPIYQSDMTVDERCDSLQSSLAGTRFATSLIGMGADGHFASLFPDADRLQAGLNPTTQHFYIPIKTDASPHARVSMTLAALLRSDSIILLCFGNDKREVIAEASADPSAYPVSHLLHQTASPVTIYWAP